MTGADGRAPYVGVRSFDAEDADLFYGRDDESGEVATLWSSHRLLVLYGESGVGKTSLVSAGVGARISPGEAEILPVGRVSRASAMPTAALGRHNPYTFALLSSWAPDDSPTRLSGLSVADFFAQRREAAGRRDHPLPVLAAVDRFEEVFRDVPHRRRHRDEFIRHLSDAIRKVPRLRLLISIREDSLPSLLPYEPTLSEQSRARFRLLPLAPRAALRAITGPLAGTGRRFGAGVAERLVDDLRTTEIFNNRGASSRVVADTVEPVQLQVVCSGLWDALPADVDVITADHLRDHGDVDRTLAEFCARAVADVADDHGVREDELRRWLARTFVTELGTRNTVYEGMSETAGMPNAVVRALQDRHVLRVEWRSGSHWYELAHDRLIQPVRSAAGRLAGPERARPTGTPTDYLRTAEGALADGELELARKHAEEAVHLAEQLDDGEPRVQAEAESFLGNLAFNSGSYSDAEDHYRRAAELFELLRDSTAVGMLLAAIGQLLLREGRHAEAVSDLQGAVARLQGNRMLRVELARALRFAGQLRGAAGVYGGVLTFAPDATEALSERGQLRAELGEYAGSLDDLDNLARLNPEIAARPEVRAARGRALAGLNRLDGARVEVERAVAEAPDDPTVQVRAAAVLALVHEPAVAVGLLRAALAAKEPALLPHQRTEATRLLESLTEDDE